MQFLCLIYETESLMTTRSDEENGKIFQGYMSFTENVKEAGKLVTGDALQPTNTATTVRVRNGETVITDGPFAETKEQLGGYYLLECESLDEAIELAAKIPSSEYGSIEVRPIMVFDNQ
ncbi:YciI family protein [Aliikangiella coralliicola]|uniref:YciI family protein n=1 Tax=Aliikangiella coralliicola TaxID=2592383 RepID=A0A545UFA1_9GAMM|nr:YciI family protein [Aliikangiella coralliicola]TQV88156.1 YciI family protein [Aliikangiella coralliicola]